MLPKAMSTRHPSVPFLCKMMRHYSDLSYIHHVGETPLKYISLGRLLEQTALEYPERDALISVEEKKKTTYSGLLDHADRLAAGLQQLEIKYGDRVGLWAPNIFEWNIISMACARAGFVAVTLNPAYTAQEMEYCINKIDVKAIICPDTYRKLNFYEKLCKIIPNLEQQTAGKLNNERTSSLSTIVLLSERKLGGTYDYNDVVAMASDASIKNIKENQCRVNPDHPVNIQFTSGTTGEPKAAIISHYNVVNNSVCCGKRNELDLKHHKICVQVPFFHGYGYTITAASAIAYGATLVIPSVTYNPLRNLNAIKEEKCTMIHGTPTMYVDLVNVQRKKNEDIYPEIALSGGAPCSPVLFENMRKHLNVQKVKSVYGLSETTAVAFQSMGSEDEYQTLNTIGHVGDHLEVKVVDEYNNVVPMGTPGELCVRGYNTTLGYWKDPTKTNEMIDKHRWLRTGDQFILQKDGYGKIVGRLKDMIIRGGENIFPKEIEDVLNTHDDILESHEVCACVRVRNGAQITLETIVEYCAGKLAKFKIPSQLKIINDFPKTQSGKIKKGELRKSLEGKI
ncbi:hypothetical protein RI129_006589 [Pyrocoelia pectoralis]|uniref:Medium-chain acyl-CoA ligase ACSF2, mitochondrial n=1 Tax=Pyrocoelia pectoralis TaxID=417401 RepID=A0AAN7VKB0_9COLE